LFGFLLFSYTLCPCISSQCRSWSGPLRSADVKIPHMNKDLLGSVVLAAATAALVSNGMTILAQWRERAARQRELLFSAAIDLSKTWVGRIANISRKNAPLTEVMAVERVYEMFKWDF
jgi:hypothetical protein